MTGVCSRPIIAVHAHTRLPPGRERTAIDTMCESQLGVRHMHPSEIWLIVRLVADLIEFVLALIGSQL